eukprot:TRINITY_DN1402_c0_g1_i1.p1 TRINITY_DN1402_c0_g1~~TRINITY_DN1402_c0_g1_i1.p1  ORF type:complete len:282 (+),score=58.42 TRINITY_DN1402_c0_g1_i1:327-1172(+)
MAEAIEIDLQKILSKGLIILVKKLPGRDAFSSSEDFDDIALIEFGPKTDKIVYSSNITLFEAVLLLSFDKDSFSRVIADGIGGAIYFDLVLREIVKLGKITSPSFSYLFRDCLINGIEFHTSTNVPILDKAVHKLMKRVNVEKEKNLRSIEWMRSFGGWGLFDALKNADKTCIEHAVHNGLFTSEDHTTLGVFHSKAYKLTPKGQAEQARLISLVRAFGLNGITPDNLFDFAVIVLFYFLNLHHRHCLIIECVKEDVVFHTKEDVSESRKNMDSRFKTSKE